MIPIISVALTSSIFIYAMFITGFSLLRMDFETNYENVNKRFTFYITYHFYLNIIFVSSISYICYNNYLPNNYGMPLLEFLKLFFTFFSAITIAILIHIGICLDNFKKNINSRWRCVNIFILPLILSITLIILNPILIKHETVFWLFTALLLTTLIQCFTWKPEEENE